MTEGLVWSALLLVFIGLGWLGWREYQKVENYRLWAEQFERSKYDIYAVLGQSGEMLTWGRPTRKGPIDLMSCSFAEIESVQLRVDGQLVEDLQQLPDGGNKILLELVTPKQSRQIPFTDVAIAADWTQYLRQALKS